MLKRVLYVPEPQHRMLAKSVYAALDRIERLEGALGSVLVRAVDKVLKEPL